MELLRERRERREGLKEKLEVVMASSAALGEFDG